MRKLILSILALVAVLATAAVALRRQRFQLGTGLAGI